MLEQLADAFNSGEASLDLGEALRQLAQGIKQPLGIKDEGGEGAKAHGTAEHHPAAQGKHHGHGGQGYPFDEGRDGAVKQDCAVDGLAICGGDLGETGAVGGLAAEHLHHLQALEVFLQIGVELAELLAHPVVGLTEATLQPKNAEHHRHLADQQQQAEPPLDRDHRDCDHQQGDQVGQHTHGATAKHLR